MIIVKITGSGLPRFKDAIEVLGSRQKAETAYRRGLNKAGQMVFTRIKRTVAAQMGTTQAALVEHGGLRRIPAKGGSLETTIVGSGKFLPLKDFNAVKRARGISAAPWKKRRIFGGTFFAFDSNVFARTDRWNKESRRHNNIKKLWGPALPREMVRDESRAVFETLGPKVLQAEVTRQIKLMTKGAVS